MQTAPGGAGVSKRTRSGGFRCTQRALTRSSRGQGPVSTPPGRGGAATPPRVSCGPLSSVCELCGGGGPGLGRTGVGSGSSAAASCGRPLQRICLVNSGRRGRCLAEGVSPRPVPAPLLPLFPAGRSPPQHLPIGVERLTPPADGEIPSRERRELCGRKRCCGREFFAVLSTASMERGCAEGRNAAGEENKRGGGGRAAVEAKLLRQREVTGACTQTKTLMTHHEEGSAIVPLMGDAVFSGERDGRQREWGERPRATGRRLHTAPFAPLAGRLSGLRDAGGGCGRLHLSRRRVHPAWLSVSSRAPLHERARVFLRIPRHKYHTAACCGRAQSSRSSQPFSAPPAGGSRYPPSRYLSYFPIGTSRAVGRGTAREATPCPWRFPWQGHHPRRPALCIPAGRPHISVTVGTLAASFAVRACVID